MDRIHVLETDTDVLKVINRISQSKIRDELHIYLEHRMVVMGL